MNEIPLCEGSFRRTIAREERTPGEFIRQGSAIVYGRCPVCRQHFAPLLNYTGGPRMIVPPHPKTVQP